MAAPTFGIPVPQVFMDGRADMELVATSLKRAEELGCLAELERALEIPGRGTSARRQIGTYERALEAGKSPAAALRDVVDMLIAETVKDLQHPEGGNDRP